MTSVCWTTFARGGSSRWRSGSHGALVIPFLLAYNEPTPRSCPRTNAASMAFDDARMTFDVRFTWSDPVHIFDLEVSFCSPGGRVRRGRCALLLVDGGVLAFWTIASYMSGARTLEWD